VTGYGGEVVTGTVTAARALADEEGFGVELAGGLADLAQADARLASTPA
jgi:hypothetical protein